MLEERSYRNGRIKIRPANTLDAAIIALSLREKDVLECKALAGDIPIREAVADSVRTSRRAFVVSHDGVAVMIFGVADLEGQPHVGVPWMLATDGIDQLGFTFARHGREIANEVFAGYAQLYNLTIMQHASAHRWLKHLGFEFGEPLPGFGANGENVIPFFKEQPPCAVPQSPSP